MRNDLGRIPTDLRWGVAWGGRVGVALALFGVVVIGLRVIGAGGEPGGPLLLGLLSWISWYIIGGLVTGGIVGLLRPLGGNRMGAALVGFLAALPLSFGTYALLVGVGRFSAPVTIVSLITAGAGGIAGLIIGGHDGVDRSR